MIQLFGYCRYKLGYSNSMFCRCLNIVSALSDVTSSPLVQSEPHASIITNKAPRAGITQPTVLLHRHDQQVRPAPRVVPTPVRSPIFSGPRQALPIQYSWPPSHLNAIKAHAVLLKQSQPTNQLVTVTTLTRTVSPPTEPVPRSVVNQMPHYHSTVCIW